MNHTDILKKIFLGSSVAEDERKNLSQYFISTNSWEKLLDDSVDIVYGSKGTGKSALYLLLSDHRGKMLERGIHIIQGENVSEDPVFRTLDDQKEDKISEQEFSTIWKLYILSLLGNYIREHLTSLSAHKTQPILKKLEKAGLIPINGLSGILKAARKYISSVKAEAQIQEIKYSISISEPTSDEEKMGVVSAQSLIKDIDKILQDEGKSIWILFDRLDVAFTKPETETPALRALFRVYRDLSGLNNLKLKIFLRNDIWERITKEDGFREQSHITRTLTIDWTETSLKHLVLSRFFSNESFEKFSGLKKDSGLLEPVLQKKAFEYIFPSQVELGSKKSGTFDWILKRVQDGKQNFAPREVIQLITTAKDEQIRMDETGSGIQNNNYLISSNALKKAHEGVSKRKIEAFYSEYPDLRLYIEAFKTKKTEHDQKTIEDIFAEYALKSDTTIVINRLVDIGFLQEKKSASGKKTYWVPFIFRPYLKMSQGTAFEKDKSIEF